MADRSNPIYAVVPTAFKLTLFNEYSSCRGMQAVGPGVTDAAFVQCPSPRCPLASKPYCIRAVPKYLHESSKSPPPLSTCTLESQKMHQASRSRFKQKVHQQLPLI